ncbi:hypothetical protein ACSJM2_10565 [Serratia marcescens]|uniref:hypothetical protein n=1 Tax=Serratia marcescens TaxID=615 RepID=UPI00383912B9|nr:hypothetical protein [Serratia marcescens]
MKIVSRAFEAVTEAELRSIRSLLSDAFPEITDGFYRRQVPVCLVTAAEGEAIVGQLAVHKRPVLIDGETEVRHHRAGGRGTNASAPRRGRKHAGEGA